MHIPSHTTVITPKLITKLKVEAVHYNMNRTSRTEVGLVGQLLYCRNKCCYSL